MRGTSLALRASGALALLALFSFGAVHCGRNEAPSPVADAGPTVDASRREASTFPDIDSGPPPEAGPDTGPNFRCDAGWVAVAGLPDECQVCAWTPAAPPPAPIPWKPCPVLPETQGLPCEILQSDLALTATNFPTATVRSGQTVVSAALMQADASSLSIVQRNDEHTIGAFRYTPKPSGATCATMEAWASESMVGTTARLWRRSAGVELGSGVAAGRRPALNRYATQHFTAIAPGELLDAFGIFREGATRATFGYAELIDFDDLSKTFPIYDASGYGGDLGLPRDDLPDGIGTATWKGLYWVGSRSGPPRLKLDGRQYADGSDVLGVASDGTDLVWTRGYGGHPATHEREHGELWRAPYNDPDPLAHGMRVLQNDALLRTLAIQSVVGGGYIARDVRSAASGRFGVVLVRLRDGHRWEFRENSVSIPRWDTMQAEAVDGVHLYVSVATHTPPSNIIRQALVRFRIADLGDGIAP